MIMEDIKELAKQSSLSTMGVELVDNELATVYMNSKKAKVNNRTHTKHCVETHSHKHVHLHNASTHTHAHHQCVL